MTKTLAIAYRHAAGGKEAKPELAPAGLDLKSIGAERSHKDFASIEIWSSGFGIERTYNFLTPDEGKRREERRKKDDAAMAETDRKRQLKENTVTFGPGKAAAPAPVPTPPVKTNLSHGSR